MRCTCRSHPQSMPPNDLHPRSARAIQDSESNPLERSNMTVRSGSRMAASEPLVVVQSSTVVDPTKFTNREKSGLGIGELRLGGKFRAASNSADRAHAECPEDLVETLVLGSPACACPVVKGTHSSILPWHRQLSSAWVGRFTAEQFAAFSNRAQFRAALLQWRRCRSFSFSSSPRTHASRLHGRDRSLRRAASAG